MKAKEFEFYYMGNLIIADIEQVAEPLESIYWEYGYPYVERRGDSKYDIEIKEVLDENDESINPEQFIVQVEDYVSSNSFNFNTTFHQIK